MGRESRHSETGAWFMNSSTLSEWKASGSSSLLWIHGKRWFPAHLWSFANADELFLQQLALARVYFGTLSLYFFALIAYTGYKFHNH